MADRTPDRAARPKLWPALFAGGLVAIGAFTDTTGFRGLLLHLLPDANGAVTWVISSGATSLALLLAWNVGVQLHNRRHAVKAGRPWRIWLLVVVWLVLGAALFYVRWHGVQIDPTSAGGDASSSFGAGEGGPTPASVSYAHLSAIFYAAVYLASGICTIVEAELVYNPAYFAFIRASKALELQEDRTTAAVGYVTYSANLIEQCLSDVDANDALRRAAIKDRQAFGAELAHHARELMAAHLRDPAKTNLTDSGPVPDAEGWDLDGQRRSA